jgi:hypothetical protein
MRKLASNSFLPVQASPLRSILCDGGPQRGGGFMAQDAGEIRKWFPSGRSEDDVGEALCLSLMSL